MLTDLYLQKYLQGRLSDQEAKDLEDLLEKNPELQKRLEGLQDNHHTVGRPVWERTHLERHNRRGSRIRYTTLLPGLLILVLVLMLAAHWFGKPGGNSTFIHAGGNGTAVELLYGTEGGWRYIDKDFRTGDSLTFIIRDGGSYSIKVFGIYPGLPDPVAEEIWESPGEKRFSRSEPEPVFPSRTPQGSQNSPKFLAVMYDTASLSALQPEEVPGLLREGGGGGRAPSFRYQVFRVPDSDR